MVPNQHQNEAAVAWNLFRILLRSLSEQLKSIVDSTEWHTCLCSVMPGWTWRLSRWDFNPTWIRIQSCGLFLWCYTSWLEDTEGSVAVCSWRLCVDPSVRRANRWIVFLHVLWIFFDIHKFDPLVLLLVCFCKIMSLQSWCWTNASCNAAGKMFNQLGAEQVPVLMLSVFMFFS